MLLVWYVTKIASSINDTYKIYNGPNTDLWTIMNVPRSRINHAREINKRHHYYSSCLHTIYMVIKLI